MKRQQKHTDPAVLAPALPPIVTGTPAIIEFLLGGLGIIAAAVAAAAAIPVIGDRIARAISYIGHLIETVANLRQTVARQALSVAVRLEYEVARSLSYVNHFIGDGLIPWMERLVQYTIRDIRNWISYLHSYLQYVVSWVSRELSHIYNIVIPNVYRTIYAVRDYAQRLVFDVVMPRVRWLEQVTSVIWDNVRRIYDVVVPQIWQALREVFGRVDRIEHVALPRIAQEIATLSQLELSHYAELLAKIGALDLALIQTLVGVKALEGVLEDVKARTDRCQLVHNELTLAYNLPDIDPVALGFLFLLMPLIVWMGRALPEAVTELTRGLRKIPETLPHAA